MELIDDTAQLRKVLGVEARLPVLHVRVEPEPLVVRALLQRRQRDFVHLESRTSEEAR